MSKTLAVRLRAARHAMHPPITQREIAKRFRVTLRRYTEEAGERLLLADDARWPIVRLEPRAHVLGCVAEVTIRKLLM